MSGTDIREILAEEPQVPRHKDALDSLMRLGCYVSPWGAHEAYEGLWRMEPSFSRRTCWVA